MRIKYLQTLLVTSLKNNKINKIKFFLNLAIFLSVFAISSTIISIYYEAKITNIESEITENQRLINIIYPTINSIPMRTRTIESTYDDIIKEQELITFFSITKIGYIFSDRDKYYNPTIKLSPFLEAGFFSIDQYLNFMIYDSNAVGEKYKEYYKKTKQEDLNELRKINSSDKKRYEEIKIEVEKQNKKSFVVEGDVEVVKNPEEFYKPFEGYYNEFQKFSKNQIKAYLLTKKTYRTIFNNLSNLNIKLTKEISRNSNLSQRFILIAFLIQFIIFLVVQGMEIISTRREINEI